MTAVALPYLAMKLRRHRLELELALAERTSLAAARRRLFEQRLADIAGRRRQERDARLQPARPTLWYQREDL